MTFGVGSSTGSSYRAQLRSQLVAAGHATINMVGSVRHGSAPGFVDNDCECYSGNVISQLSARTAAAVPQFKPNVVLVEMGTNNCNAGGTIPDAGANVTRLITQTIFPNASPGAVVLLTTVIFNPSAAQEACRLDLNTQYRAVAGALQAQGLKVVLVDQRAPPPGGGPQDVVGASDLADGRHPNDGGYAKMARIWAAGFAQAQQKGWFVEPVALDSVPLDGDQGRINGTGTTQGGLSGGAGKGAQVGGANASGSLVPAGSSGVGGARDARGWGAAWAVALVTGLVVLGMAEF